MDGNYTFPAPPLIRTMDRWLERKTTLSIGVVGIFIWK